MCLLLWHSLLFRWYLWSIVYVSKLNRAKMTYSVHGVDTPYLNTKVISCLILRVCLVVVSLFSIKRFLWSVTAEMSGLAPKWVWLPPNVHRTKNVLKCDLKKFWICLIWSQYLTSVRPAAQHRVFVCHRRRNTPLVALLVWAVDRYRSSSTVDPMTNLSVWLTQYSYASRISPLVLQ